MDGSYSRARRVARTDRGRDGWRWKPRRRRPRNVIRADSWRGRPARPGKPGLKPKPADWKPWAGRLTRFSHHVIVRVPNRFGAPDIPPLRTSTRQSRAADPAPACEAPELPFFLNVARLLETTGYQMNAGRIRITEMARGPRVDDRSSRVVRYLRLEQPRQAPGPYPRIVATSSRYKCLLSFHRVRLWFAPRNVTTAYYKIQSIHVETNVVARTKWNIFIQYG